MQAPKVYINGFGHFHPEHVLDNSFFDTLNIESDAAWIADRTGIQSRRSVLNPEIIQALREQKTTLRELRQEQRVLPLSALAFEAWTNLVSRFPDQAGHPDAVMCGTSIPDFDIPANACSIASRLGWSCPSFDVNSACSSFVVNLQVASSLLRSSTYRRIAVFNPERYSLRMDFSDKKSCVLFGDGSAATILSTQPSPGAFEIIDTIVHSDPSKYDLVAIPDGEHFSQHGQAVQKFAVTRTIEATQMILNRNGLSIEETPLFFVGHQANLRMVLSVCEKLAIPEQRHLFNVNQFGNQGAAGAPCTLSMYEYRIPSNSYVVVAVVGSGLTWGSALLRRC